ncbi:PilN domain-containing protein [Hahella sp. SMD15-11]|uniref:PilN domain-containing protein n=1 Tax=Thermohahella caldifontis TaxID=3142973 RepID=A0AB39V0E1_9GAMM
MAKINLRPWREELRAEKQKQFLTALLGVAIIAVGLGFLWHQQVLRQIEYQEQRNNFIRSEMAQLEKQIREIQDLKKKRKELIERMRVIQDLQGKRPVIVRIFDELVRTLPDGVYYTSLVREGDTLRISGLGESNSRISSLMRNLDRSPWFTEPNLTSVKAAEDGDREGMSAFELTVRLETPEEQDTSSGARS